ncbi:MAG TPA: hypothetical protein VFS43_15905, partial [Polyangiaceae bacterium]|nr:hypothetical protein [Polyangiaceae bacterium]
APGGGFGGAPGTPSGGSGGAGGMVATMGAGPGGGGGKGGSGPVPDAEAATPGTRLKPKVFVGADGSRQPSTSLWHDTQRNEECSFRLAADGAYRCLPTSAAISSGYFQDAGCTTPALAVYVSCGVPSVPAYASGFSACGVSAGLYQRGSVLSSVYIGQPGSCSFHTSSSYAFYSLSEVPPASFAAAELRVE